MVSGTFALYASSRIVIPEGATSAAIDVMGTYTKVPRLAQGGFPVYQRVGPSVQYLFFWPAFQRWLIGPDYKTGLSSVQSRGGFAFGVDQVAGDQVAGDPPCTMDQRWELLSAVDDTSKLMKVMFAYPQCSRCIIACEQRGLGSDCGVCLAAPDDLVDDLSSCPDEASDWVIFDGQGGWVSTFPITVREGMPRLLPSTGSLI